MSEPIAFEIAHRPSFGGRLRGLLNPSAKPGRRPAVVICHGFKGFMEWGFFPPLADLLAERGLTVIRFNFSGSGMQPGDELVTDLEAFRRNTFSLERLETLAVLDAVAEGLDGLTSEIVDPDLIALVGHSRGGAAALLAAADARWRERLKALITWSAIASFDRYGLESREAWRKEGFLPLNNARTGQALKLGVELLDDVETHRESLNLETAASLRRAPWLIVHGEADETVPIQEALSLFEASQTRGQEKSPECLLEQVAGGSHTFGARHPFTGPTRELIQAMNATQLFLRRHLAG